MNRDDLTLITASNGEDNIQLRGKSLYSRYAPSTAVERAIPKIPLYENCIYFIPSPLLAYGLESLLDKIPESSILLCIETDQEIMALCSPYQQKILSSRLQSFRVSQTAGLYRIFRSIQKDSLYRRCHLTVLNAAYGLNRQLYDSLFSSLEHFLKNYWQNRMTLSKMGPLWIKNMFSNTRELHQKDITDFHTEKAIVLCGAGDSLEHSLSLIKRHRDSIYLLAVDTAVQTLLRSGITADGVVNLEAQFYNLKDFYGLEDKEFDLFSDISAYPASIRYGRKARHYLFSSVFDETGFQKRLKAQNILPTEIPPLGSVGVTALYLADLISKGPIFITGLDFSYEMGKTHAKGSPFHDWTVLQQNRFNGDTWYAFSALKPSHPAECKHSTQSRTNSILESYGRQLEDLVLNMERQVFDIAQRGLKTRIPTCSESDFPILIQHAPDTDKSEITKLSSDKQNRVISFVSEEKIKLGNILELWEEISSGEKKEEDILPLLAECDYLYFHFPDRKQVPNTDPAFLFRVIYEARNLLKRME